MYNSICFGIAGNDMNDFVHENDLVCCKKWHGCVCVCVCVERLNRGKTSTFSFLAKFNAGGHSISLGLCPTKLPVKWDIQLGQLDVPAIFDFSVKWQPAKPRTGLGNYLDDFNFCTAFAISRLFLFWLFGSLFEHFSPFQNSGHG